MDEQNQNEIPDQHVVDELDPAETRIIAFQVIKLIDDELLTVLTGDGNIYINLSQMCVALDLKELAQILRIKRTRALSMGLRLISLDSSHQDMHYLRMDKVSMWLTGVQKGTVKSELHTKLEAYQNELVPMIIKSFLLGNTTPTIQRETSNFEPTSGSSAPPQRPKTDDLVAWRNYWQSMKHPVRNESEIDAKRQIELARCCAIAANIDQAIYPFKDVKLTRADIKWLLKSYGNQQQNVRSNEKNQSKHTGIDLRGADLRQVDLGGLSLSGILGGLDWDEWRGRTQEQREAAAIHLEGANLYATNLEGALLNSAHLEGAYLSEANVKDAELNEAFLEGVDFWRAHLERTFFSNAHLEGAIFYKAYLEKAYLYAAHLEGANLYAVHLEGADLSHAHLEGKNLSIEEHERIRLWKDDFPNSLQPANLCRAFFDNTTNLEGITLGNQEHGFVSLADAQWNNVNLAVVDWTEVNMLGDEREALLSHDSKGAAKDKSKRLNEHKSAVRANRQISIAFQEQGLNEYSASFAYRAQVLQRQMFLQQVLVSLDLQDHLLDDQKLRLQNLLIQLTPERRERLSSMSWFLARGILTTDILKFVWIPPTLLTKWEQKQQLEQKQQMQEKMFSVSMLVLLQILVFLYLLIVLIIIAYSLLGSLQFLWNLMSRTADQLIELQHFLRCKVSSWQQQRLLRHEQESLLLLELMEEQWRLRRDDLKMLPSLLFNTLAMCGKFTFSLLLDIIAGYGYRPGRSLFWYLTIIFGFTTFYLLYGHLGFLEAFVLSLTSFHGRGFLPNPASKTPLADPLVVSAAIEAVVGLFIEISFIATFTQRFLGK